MLADKNPSFVSEQINKNRSFIAFDEESGNVLMVVENGKPLIAGIEGIKVKSIFEKSLEK